MKKRFINVRDLKYEIVDDSDNCFNDEIIEKITDYFDSFDYIFGDYAYEKVRLKGFYDSNNKKAKKINDIKYLNDYKKDYCSYGAKTFLLKKVE